MTPPLPAENGPMKPPKSRDMPLTFHIEWGGEADLLVEDIWPDGDAPENPTWEDVIAVMSKSRSVRALARDWMLDIEGVEVNGHDSGLR